MNKQFFTNIPTHFRNKTYDEFSSIRRDTLWLVLSIVLIALVYYGYVGYKWAVDSEQRAYRVLSNQCLAPNHVRFTEVVGQWFKMECGQ